MIERISAKRHWVKNLNF